MSELFPFRNFCISAVALLTILIPVETDAHKQGSLHKKSEYRPELREAAMNDSLRNALMENAPAEFESPSQFFFTSKNKKFVFGIGGYAKGTLSFDFGSPIDNPTDFVVSSIPVSTSPSNGGKVQLSAQNSSLYTNFVFNPGKNQVGAFLGIDLSGGNYIPQIQYAFVRYRGFQAGYDVTLFADPSVCPPSIDSQGPNSYLYISTPSMRYEKDFGRNRSWKAGIALELPQADYTVRKGLNETVNQRIPDIPAYVRYSWDNNAGWLRMAAILRNMYYRDLVEQKNRISTGWGLSLTGNIGILPNKLSFVFQATYGHGISSYYQDLNGDGEGEDLFPSATDKGKLEATPSWGGFAGFQYNFSSRCYASLSYSHLRVYNSKTIAPPEYYRYGQYLLSNLFYDINSQLTWGIEYIYGRRMNMNASQNHDNRIQTMLQFSF